MREILFRGKRADNGEWVEGSLFQDIDSGYFVIEYFDYYTDESGLQKDFCQYNVIPETVGQYTGLNDKNGNKIFEGDILSAMNENIYAEVKYNDEKAAFFIENDDGDGYFGEEYDTDIDIVGNIHDNPELLNRRVDNGKV